MIYIVAFIVWGLRVYALYFLFDYLIDVARLMREVVYVFMNQPTPETLSEIRQDMQRAREEYKREALDNPRPIITLHNLAYWVGIAAWVYYFYTGV